MFLSVHSSLSGCSVLFPHILYHSSTAGGNGAGKAPLAPSILSEGYVKVESSEVELHDRACELLLSSFRKAQQGQSLLGKGRTQRRAIQYMRGLSFG